jgi:hypothetical protein
MSSLSQAIVRSSISSSIAISSARERDEENYHVRKRFWVYSNYHFCRIHTNPNILLLPLPAVHRDPTLPYINALPPSTGNSIPVIKLASSLARKLAAFATSAGVAKRPNGMPAVILALPSGVSVPPMTDAALRV